MSKIVLIGLVALLLVGGAVLALVLVLTTRGTAKSRLTHSLEDENAHLREENRRLRLELERREPTKENPEGFTRKRD